MHKYIHCWHKNPRWKPHHRRQGIVFKQCHINEHQQFLENVSSGNCRFLFCGCTSVWNTQSSLSIPQSSVPFLYIWHDLLSLFTITKVNLKVHKNLNFASWGKLQQQSSEWTRNLNSFMNPRETWNVNAIQFEQKFNSRIIFFPLQTLLLFKHLVSREFIQRK